MIRLMFYTVLIGAALACYLQAFIDEIVEPDMAPKQVEEVYVRIFK